MARSGKKISSKEPDDVAADRHTKINDPRFSNIHTDPRYRLPSKKHTRVKIDKRFASLLHDDEFLRKARVDKYGRSIPKGSNKKELQRLYLLEDDADEEDRIEADSESALDKKYDPAREGGFSSSEDESSSEEDDDVSDREDSAEEEVWGTAGEEISQGHEIPMGEVTSRLAVVNLDWDHVRAQDIMAVFQSFLPPEGRILKVSVYPSEFGRERMEREELEGPPRELFRKNIDSEIGIDSESLNGAPELDEAHDEDEKIREELVKEDEGVEVDSAKLRRYQLERLRYYYAVLELSSRSTAKALYDAIDGTEYLATANFFDLRFIPDDTNFEDKARDECHRIPDGYRPNEFVTDALQHSKVRLTWDADDDTRKQVQKKAFTASRKELDENDLKAYLGSDSSEEEDGSAEDEERNIAGPSKKEAERQRMRALLGLSDAPPSRRAVGAPVGDMQVTFTSGLASDQRNDSIFENDPIKEETTIEQYIRKEKERKARRKEKLKANRTGDSSDLAEVKEKKPAKSDQTFDEQTENQGFDDPFFDQPEEDLRRRRKDEKRKKREQRAMEEAENAAERAQLELLMVDDNGQELKHFDMNEIERAEKNARRGKKGKRRGKATDQAAEQDQEHKQSDFRMDVDDPRFKELFENHEFAIDPTNPRYKGTQGMKALLEAGRKKRARNEPLNKDVEAQTKKKQKKSAGQDDIQRLVQKVKTHQRSSG